MKTSSAWKSIAVAAILQFAFQSASSNGWVKDITYLGIDNSPQVIQTNDGGYLLSTKKEGHPFLIKTDSNGNVTWTKWFENWMASGCPTNQEIIQKASDGGYVLVACNSSLIAKLNAGGDILWTKTLDGYPFQVKPTIDNGYIVLAASKWYGYPPTILLKLNDNGDILWTKSISRPDYIFHGWSLDVMDDGGFIIGGERTSNDTLNPDYGAFMARTNASGDTLWTKLVGNEYCIIQYIQAIDGGYLCAGEYYENYVSGRVFMTDSYGFFNWAFENGCIAQSGFVLDETADNNIVVVGKANNTICKLTPGGSLIWEKSLGLAGRSLRQTTDGGYILTADNDDVFGGNYLYYLMKTDANGNTSGTTSLQTANTLQAGLTITPNPFDDRIQLDCTLAHSGNVRIEMLNVLGELVGLLKDAFVAEGNYTFTFQTDIPSGIYFLRIQSKEGQAAQKIVRR